MQRLLRVSLNVIRRYVCALIIYASLLKIISKFYSR